MSDSDFRHRRRFSRELGEAERFQNATCKPALSCRKIWCEWLVLQMEPQMMENKIKYIYTYNIYIYICIFIIMGDHLHAFVPSKMLMRNVLLLRKTTILISPGIWARLQVKLNLPNSQLGFWKTRRNNRHVTWNTAHQCSDPQQWGALATK